MNTPLTRQALLATLDSLREHWIGHTPGESGLPFSEQVVLLSSHRGRHEGRSAVLSLLAADLQPLQQLELEFSNPVVRANAREGVATSYFHATAQGGGQALQFGGLVVLSINSEGVSEIRIQFAWSHGDFGFMQGWNMPPADRQWKPGDASAVLMSELDAPWNRIANSTLATTDEQEIAQVWFRYAWALDQADFALLQACFSEDVEAELTPMGRMHGRRELISTLKAFRMPWPWMQHCGAPIAINIEPGERTALLTIGRIIPGKTSNTNGQKVYGAHYRIKLARQREGQWAITFMEYQPGWFTA